MVTVAAAAVSVAASRGGWRAAGCWFCCPLLLLFQIVAVETDSGLKLDRLLPDSSWNGAAFCWLLWRWTATWLRDAAEVAAGLLLLLLER